MKCVKTNGKKGIKVIRVTDDRATYLVSVGRGEYTNKEEWKKAGRKYQ